jgi:outer membrane beta-barrel protein
MPRRRVVSFALAFCLLVPPTAVQADPQFENYEIRVIRPRYFVKSGRAELSAGLGAIMNQTFIYAAVATGLLTWHFTEQLGVEAQAGYALDIDRDDKIALDDSFHIKTILLRPETLANARLVWTPSYGKFNLTASDIVYFDTHVTVGAGYTGIRYVYDHCEPPDPMPASHTVQYPTVVLGLGQSYFLSKSSSLRIGLELQRFRYDTADGACAPDEAPSAAATNDDVLLFSAWSYYL